MAGVDVPAGPGVGSAECVDMRLRWIVGIATLVASLAPGAGVAAPVAGERCADVYVPLRNFKVEAKWERPTVAVGDVAKLQVLVTRTAEEDPVTDEGVPYPTGRPMDEPVEDVSVGISMLVGNVYLNGVGLTNAEGQATVNVKIHAYTKPGVGSSRVYAEKRHTPPDFPSPACRVILLEWGKLDPGPKLKVTR